MKDRGHPWSIGVPVSQVGDADHCSWAEIEEMNANGAEICVHPAVDFIQDSDDTILDMVESYREDIEARGIDVQRINTADTPDFQSKADFETFGGRFATGAFNSLTDLNHTSGYDLEQGWAARWWYL